MPGRRLPILILPITLTFTVLVLLVLPVFFIGYGQYHSHLEDSEKQECEEELDSKCHMLSVEISHVITSLDSLSLINEINRTSGITEDEFQELSDIVISTSTDLVSAGLIQDGIMTFSNPELLKVLFNGVDFFNSDNETIRLGVEKLLNTGDPQFFHLFPGNDENIIIAAKAYFLEGEPWGITALLVNITGIVESAGIMDSEMGIQILDDHGTPIWGEKESSSRKVTVEIPVGESKWTVTGYMQEELEPSSKREMGYAISVFILISGLFLTVIFTIAFSNRRLHKLVEMRTSELKEETEKLHEENIKRKRTEKEVKDEKERAEMYMDLLSHDIGNLHQGVLVNLQLLQRNKVKDEMKENTKNASLELMKRSIDLVSNVKLITYLKARDAKLVPLNISEAIDASIGEIKKTFPERDINISYEGKKKLMVMADPLIIQVFTNLIGNCVKVQDAGSPFIRIRSKMRSDSVEISIADQGPGIDDDLKPLIFDRTQMKKMRKRSHGIGLMVVKALMDRYDGSVEVVDRVEGEPSRGAKFVLKLKKGV